MRNYKITISYDGTGYKGWQRQGLTEQTIQEILETSAAQLLGYPVELHGSGRTDAGVHAIGQVASMKVAGLLPEDFCEKWNCILPDDIQIRSAVLVKSGFHGRYNAVRKHYRYVVDMREKPDVFRRKYACHYPQELDVEAMEQAAGQLVGTHDFTTFTDDKSEKSKTRTIHKIDIQKEGNLLFIDFYGDGFLYHMVRILSGTLLQIGTGEKCVADVSRMLSSKERQSGGFLAPAKGLFLVEVEYD